MKTSVRAHAKISALSSTTIGASRAIIRCFHLALVTSCIQYACPAWYERVSDTDMDSLNRSQARGARLACSLPSTTNTHDSLLEGNILPIKETIRFLTYKYLLLATLRGGPRARNAVLCYPESSETGNLHKNITSYYGDIEPLSQAPSLNARVAIRTKTLRSVTKDMSDGVKREASEEAIAHRHPPDWEMWTDGSYIDDLESVAGAAVIFGPNKRDFRTVYVCGPGFSSFRSECLALHAGLRSLTLNKRLRRGQRLLIALDSQSLLTALASHTAGETSRTFGSSVKMLNALVRRGIKVRMQFIFGHCGVYENELADTESHRAHFSDVQYPLWYKDALTIARSTISSDYEESLGRLTHRRGIVGLKPTKAHHLTNTRLINSLGSQVRVNWSPHFGDLHRILRPGTPMCCRFCSQDQPDILRHPAAQLMRAKSRCNQPIKCPECSQVISRRHLGLAHLKTIHGYEHKESARLLRSLPPSLPQDPNKMVECFYCDRNFFTVASANRHVSLDHTEAAKIRRATPPPLPPPPQSSTAHKCDLCDFESSSKGGLTHHLKRTHQRDRRDEKPHRPNDCEESASHLLFACERLQHLRIKHSIPPEALCDPEFWFSRRPADFILDALKLLPELGYECSLFPKPPTRVFHTAKLGNLEGRKATTPVENPMAESHPANKKPRIGAIKNTMKSYTASQRRTSAEKTICRVTKPPKRLTRDFEEGTKDSPRKSFCTAPKPLKRPHKEPGDTRDAEATSASQKKRKKLVIAITPESKLNSFGKNKPGQPRHKVTKPKKCLNRDQRDVIGEKTNPDGIKRRKTIDTKGMTKVRIPGVHPTSPSKMRRRKQF